MITITLLGTAALLPLPERALTSVYLSCAGKSILFDCGEGTQTAARKAGVSLMKTDLIALTHYHGDHYFGLPGLLQTMGTLGRTEPLYITGPAGLEEALAPIRTLTDWIPFELRTLQIPAEGLRLASVFPGWPPQAALSAFSTLHRVPSRGYVFTLGRAGRFLPEKALSLGVPQRLWGALQKGERVCVNGREVLPQQVMSPPRRGLKVVFTGDTAPCESLVSAAADADLLISEATYASDADAEAAAQWGHMTFAMAAAAAKKANVRRLWLTHFSQKLKDPAADLANASAIFPNAVCGTDGLRCTLNFEEEEGER